ncbi:LON peptidase substrate-binding domain-containing protein [Arsukibacterium indicum]|uniref:LON peptidase substrate-binding domain-containing protein n=1 Tax=Arsukibacterium indicum TaxID=2848612 RepID=A0ABS6MQF8_9GAMM|nr:LON peptidase substrate-binding domain-containing protein [Arsukibacterium indicum]MBV2131047.1 LON peptidase substrate-binding domain-containing protein [Arsukibacterium indicum]
MSKQLALFPLSSFILPGGKMRLRVFEKRYIRLVKEAGLGSRSFAMALLNPFVTQQHRDRILPLATEVVIEDFEQLPDGLLGITVRGVCRVEIINRWQEEDGLNVAQVTPLSSWPATRLNQRYSELASSLLQLLAEYPQLQQLYPEPELDNASWLASRWLELMPMQPGLKQKLSAEQDPLTCLESLQNWLEHNT